MNSSRPTHPLEVDCQSTALRLAQGDEFLLLDCRERDEYDLVRIEGARLIPMSELQSRVTELVEFRDREIIVHCHHGGRSLQVALWLKAQGYANVNSLAGGIDRWAIEIDPSLPRY